MSSKPVSKTNNNSKLSAYSRYNSPRKKNRSKTKSKTKKRHKSCKVIQRFPMFKKKLREQLEEKEEIEFVLGDFKDFHKIEEFQTFKNMRSLTLINESIKDISLIIQNLPNPSSLYYLCLNQNEISNLDNIDKLINLEELQINFNFIDKIPKNILNLKQLKTFWACENNINNIENIPINLESLWLANNYIENIPENFNKLVNLKQLNLAGNFISDIKDLYIISELKNLNKIYIQDINFGDNPICYFNNYRKIMVHIFNYVEIIDQIKVTFDEKYDVNRLNEIDVNSCLEKIKNNFRICLMIFRTLKTYMFFYSSVQFYKLKVFTIRLKFLEGKDKNDTNDSNYEIEDLEFKIKKLLEEYNKMKNNYSKLKKIIKELNDSFIISHSLQLETYNNIEIIPLLPNTKSSLFCINLMKSQINDEFIKSNYFTGISFNEIYQIKSTKTKYIFNALYNELIDENKLFGVDKKFKKYLFIILPDKIIQNKRKLFNFFTESQKESEIFFCDNFSYLDEKEIMYNKKNFYNGSNKTKMICKCAFFDSNVEVIDARFNYFSSIEEIKSYLINLKNNSKKDIICLKIKYNVNFYIYNNKDLILPKYIIKYNYKKNENSDFISCYEENEFNLKFNSVNEKIFNICSKNFFSEDNAKYLENFIKKEKISKHQFSKFFEYKELENNFFFLVKNSLINFLKKCFKYNDKEEYFNEIKILNEKIEEINEYKNENNFLKNYDKYIQDKTQSDINFRKIKKINLFNQNISDNIFNNFLKKISNDITKFNEISIMSIKCQVLSLAKNQLKEINLSKIFDLFPNLIKLDLSLNNITSTSISYIDDDINNNKFSSLKILNLSFNNINELDIINKFKNNLKCNEILFYGNPLITKNKSKEDSIYNKNIDKKNFLFLENIKYSFTKEINDFNNLLYFQKGTKLDYHRNYKKNILYLNNRDLTQIPNINEENNSIDCNIIYLNNNKIPEINNLSIFNNLYELYLQNNKIQMINFLPLSLKKLDLSFNYISNLNEIFKNLNLEYINLEFNNIDSITPLLCLNRLKEIYCSNNFIESLSDDDYLKLKNLKFLEILDLSRNNIIFSTDNYKLKIIFSCESLIKLNKKLVNEKDRNEANELFNNKLRIESLEKKIKNQYESDNSLIDLNQLTELDLSGLNLKDEFFMFDKKKYPNLKKLNISKNYFTSLEIFGPLPELIELNISFNYFNELFPKKYCKNFKIRFNFCSLKFLDISNNKLADIIGISNFSKLKKLNLKENYISKIDSLDKLNELNFLNISSNKLRSCDKANLGVLPSIKTFFCDNNFLKSVNCFEKFVTIENLSFNSNKITDVSCLDKLTQLKKLNKLSLMGNPIANIQNYRKIIIFYFQKLKYLDNKEIMPQERTLFNNNSLNNFNTNNNTDNFLKSSSNLNMRSKRDEMVKLYDTFNESNKYKKMKSNMKESTKNLDYFNIDYKFDSKSKISNKKFFSDLDDYKTPKRSFGSHMELNINILQSKNDKDFNRFLFLSRGKKFNKNIIPILKLSNSKKYDEIILMNKYKYFSKSKMKRPFSSSNHNRSLSYKSKPIIGKRNDYFSIVLNSFGNNDYTPLVTLKNFNIKKINF